jgi:hypothetical protein
MNRAGLLGARTLFQVGVTRGLPVYPVKNRVDANCGELSEFAVRKINCEGVFALIGFQR